MKFIFAILAVVLVLVAVGCGQNSNPPRNPAVNTPSTQPQTEPSSPNAGGTDNPSVAATVNNGTTGAPPALGVVVPAAPPSASEDAHQAVLKRIAEQEDLLAREEAAFERASKIKSTDVHFNRDFLTAIGAGLVSGALTWDFLHRTGVVNKGPVTYYRKLLPKKGAAAAAGEGAEKVAVIDIETASVVSRITSGVSALIFAYISYKYAVDAHRDYVIQFSSSEEVKAHEKNIAQARKDLAETRGNLKLLWLQSDGGVAPQ